MDIRVQINIKEIPSHLTHRCWISWSTHHSWGFLVFLKTLGSFYRMLDTEFQEEVHSVLYPSWVQLTRITGLLYWPLETSGNPSSSGPKLSVLFWALGWPRGHSSRPWAALPIVLDWEGIPCLYVQQWFTIRVVPRHPGTFINVWRHFCLLLLGGRVLWQWGTQWTEARDAAKHPEIHRTDSHSKVIQT